MKKREIRIDGDIAFVTLTKGYCAIIDADDAPMIGLDNWQVFLSRNGTPYASARAHGRAIRMHRKIMNAPDDMEVDHKNGDGLDNRKQNLRFATHSQNMSNRGGANGCTWHAVSGKWMARIKTKYIGLFDTEQEASEAYKNASKAVKGEFCPFSSRNGVTKAFLKYCPLRHGVDCEKIPHLGDGYLHDENDDTPYEVDSYIYCGRCHTALGPQIIANARKRKLIEERRAAK